VTSFTFIARFRLVCFCEPFAFCWCRLPFVRSPTLVLGGSPPHRLRGPPRSNPSTTKPGAIARRHFSDIAVPLAVCDDTQQDANPNLRLFPLQTPRRLSQHPLSQLLSRHASPDTAQASSTAGLPTSISQPQIGGCACSIGWWSRSSRAALDC
jgi:hypothetical protein